MAFVIEFGDQDRFAFLFADVVQFPVLAGSTGICAVAGLAFYFQLLFVMGIIGAVAHDLFSSVTVNADHPFPVVDVIFQFKEKAVSGQAVFREAAVFIRSAVAFCFIYSLV